MLHIEIFKHCEKLFVVHVVVELSDLECARVECDWINLLPFCHDKKDSCESIFLYIDFHNHLSIRNLVNEDQGRDEYFFKGFECFTVWKVKIPRGVFPSQLD